jgi:hypothetical protein
MYNPCFECLNRYSKQYSEECDNTCEYAIAVKYISELQDEIKSLQDVAEDLKRGVRYERSKSNLP